MAAKKIKSKEGFGGVLLLQKPQGITSHDAVDRVRKIFGTRRVGHAGTLDPLATGLLVILVGKTTKLSEKLRGQEKEYVIGTQFGMQTDTGDVDGQAVSKLDPSEEKLLVLKESEVENALSGLRGKIVQKVPLYSAVKVGGRKLYELARKGQKVETPKRQVEIKKLELHSFTKGNKQTYPSAVIHAVVSAGTYTRSIVGGLGDRLSLPTVQTSLRRLRSGKFRIEDAVSLEALSDSREPEKFLIQEPIT